MVYLNRGRTYAKKKSVFYTKKEQATQIWKTVTSHIKMRLVFSFFAPTREGL